MDRSKSAASQPELLPPLAHELATKKIVLIDRVVILQGGGVGSFCHHLFGRQLLLKDSGKLTLRSRFRTPLHQVRDCRGGHTPDQLPCRSISDGAAAGNEVKSPAFHGVEDANV